MRIAPVVLSQLLTVIWVKSTKNLSKQLILKDSKHAVVVKTCHIFLQLPDKHCDA